MKTQISCLKSLSVIFFFFYISSYTKGQTTVFSDDFTNSQGANYTYTAGLIGSSSLWSMNSTGASYGARIDGGILDLVNTTSTGAIYAYTTVSSFSTPYNPQLNLNAGQITWTFNIRQIRTDPSGWGTGSYAAAVILATSSGSALTSGTGYAITYGQTGTTDPLTLIRFTGGIRAGTRTTLLTSNTSGLADFGADYLSVKVTYDPISNEWELFVRNDGSSQFADPSLGTLVSQGSVVNNTYTSIILPYMGAVWNGSSTANQTAYFDNFKVSINLGCNISPVNVSPASANICGGDIQMLTANGGIFTDVAILSENFNAGSNNWTTFNTSTGGDSPALSAWTLRPDGYSYYVNNLHSNDNSQFYLSNSNSQGEGGTTNTVLQSPAFSTIGFTSVSCKFFQFYNHYNGSAKVEASADGSTWTTLQTFTASNGSYGSFSPVIVALPPAFINQSSVYIRYKYNAVWGYFWAIDNVSITASGASPFVWTPSNGLYSDAAASIPYIPGSSHDTVYARPNSTQTYTATALAGPGCSTFDTIKIVVTQSPAPTGPASQTFCNNATVADLQASGLTIKWYDDSIGGNLLNPTTVLINGANYYASQTIGSCESYNRLPVNVVIDPCTGIDDASAHRYALLVYPNPASQKLYVNYEQIKEIPKSIRLFNALGQMVLETDQFLGESQTVISINHLEAGIYLLQIVFATEFVNKNVIVK